MTAINVQYYFSSAVMESGMLNKGPQFSRNTLL